MSVKLKHVTTLMAAADDLLATIELYTDCMTGEVNITYVDLEKYVEAVQQAINGIYETLVEE